MERHTTDFQTFRSIFQVRKSLGLDRAKMIFTAAAPISRQTLEYFQSLNIPLCEIYGMSEAAGALTLCTPEFSRITSIGTVMGVNEYKIGNQDEDGSGEVSHENIIKNAMMTHI